MFATTVETTPATGRPELHPDWDGAMKDFDQIALQALRAHHAWAYCEHYGLATFDQRQTLCAHAEYLTAKAIATAEGRDFDAPYKGCKRMVVWPQVRLDESSEAEAETLVKAVFEYESREATP